jgi:hypothetical protein
MKTRKRISLWAAALQVGGYPKLILNLARQHGLKVHVIGRSRYLNADELDRLGQLVRDWIKRPRMSRQPRKGLEGRVVRRRRNAPSEVIGENTEP